jgi:hypothetical protein
MAASITTDFRPLQVTPLPAARSQSRRRRHITPDAGHALERLGHAIEYLTDEFVESGEEVTAHNARLEAVQILMSLNRAVYFECPEEITLVDRVRSILHRRAA